MKLKLFFSIIRILCALLLLNSCASYHTKSEAFQAKIQEGDVQEALEAIDESKFLLKSRNQLLYFLEKGKLAYLAGDYTLSNDLFNKADMHIELDKNPLGNKILGVILNPERETYQAEDFEKVAIHYYKALNYTFLNQYDEAIVEAKRITLQLQKINEQYPEGKKNRYKDDAFAHNLQGLLYEGLGDINNAFIAYRNAVDLYLENQGTYIGVDIPDQLRQDLLRTAYMMGFTDTLVYYEERLKMKYIPGKQSEGGEVVIFWENGLVPYKDATYFTFAILPGNNLGYLSIVNEELGLDIPLPIPTGGDSKADFSDVDVFNVAYPKYVHKEPFYSDAIVQFDSVSYPLQLIQDYEKIAFKTLKDRRSRELGKIALRLGIKKVSEYILRNQNSDLGALLGLFNALTEGADTRNWQSLPNTILYTRIPLKKGENKLTFQLNAKKEDIDAKNMIVDGIKSRIQFQKVSTPKTYRK